jgi:subtilase family serine protease
VTRALTPLALAFTLAAVASAQNHTPLLTGTINNAQRLTLAGNTRPEAFAANDIGQMADETPLKGLQLVLHRSAANEAAFKQLIANLHNPRSLSYHAWLSNAEIGAQFGPAPQDISKIEAWLGSQGFAVHSVSPDGMVIEFSGTASQVKTAFGTPLHRLRVNGKEHFANLNDPSIPAALAPVVAGVAKLNNFMPHAMNHRRAAVRLPNLKANGNGGNGTNYLSAADLATIYNFNPLFKAGITGKGQTIVLVEDTDQYSVGDWAVFRKVLGLSRAYPYASLTQSHPSGSSTCLAPGIDYLSAYGDDTEAALDIEWASAAAPNAAIVNAACADNTQFGGFLALANILQAVNHPTIVSISYGDAEVDLGETENLYINNLYQTAVAEGVSVFVSSGDQEAASYDLGHVSTHGIGVSGFATTPYNISVGGTDWGYAPLGVPGTYFNATNGANFQTAVSYIPEIPWNDSCAGSALVSFFNAFSGTSFTTSGSTSLCNYDGGALADSYGLLNADGGSGGPSGCATGTNSSGQTGIVSGTCAGYAKPAWQSLVGVPADGVRDIPDVSLFAANGLWGSYYAVCVSDPTGGSGLTPCTTDPSTWPGFGGTSVATPIWAGIQALVNQKTGSSWGNSNTVLYSLAAAEYGATGSANCNSSLGNAVGTGCLFYDVTQGDNAGACEAQSDILTNCYAPSGTYGILSTSNTASQPAFTSGVGWDFTTGIGTVNVANIVNNWP